MPVQREKREQTRLINWTKEQSEKYPMLDLMFAIPNGGSRDKNRKRAMLVGKSLKREGVKAGVPDLLLPWPNKWFNGLFIEMKIKPNRPSKRQKEWLHLLSEAGYLTKVCYSLEEAQKLIVKYLK